MRKLLLSAILLLPMSTAAVKIEKVPYRGWPNCYRMSNGEVELIVVTDIGPRIIRYAFIKGKNIFKEYDEQMGHSGEKEWLARAAIASGWARKIPWEATPWTTRRCTSNRRATR